MAATGGQRVAAVMLNLCCFPGIGHVFKGQGAKALIFAGFGVLSLLLTVVGIGFVTFPIVWLWAVLDGAFAE